MALALFLAPPRASLQGPSLPMFLQEASFPTCPVRIIPLPSGLRNGQAKAQGPWERSSGDPARDLHGMAASGVPSVPPRKRGFCGDRGWGRGSKQEGGTHPAPSRCHLYFQQEAWCPLQPGRLSAPWYCVQNSCLSRQ